MYWNDDTDKKAGFAVPDDVVDVAFRIACPTLPLDHAHALSSALLQVLPWLEEEAYAGIHLIHGAASGNGWFRPEDTENELLHLSKRTRMRLRVPRERLQDAQALSGQSLDIEGHPLEVGKSEVSLLSSLDETQFLQAVAEQLEALDIPCRKMLGGITHTMKFPDGALFTRSLMVADLEPEQSVRLQQVGLGEGRVIGCGLFLPHKGINPVKEPEDK